MGESRSDPGHFVLFQIPFKNEGRSVEEEYGVVINRNKRMK